jgi:hypothetical protein
VREGYHMVDIPDTMETPDRGVSSFIEPDEPER